MAAGKILVVDDELRNLKLLESMLRPEGYELEFARDGEAAIATAERFRPDVILLDVMMPGINGFTVAGKLKLDVTLKSIPIIMVTSLDDRASRVAALNMGAEEFLTKPVDRAELWVRVRNLMRLKHGNDRLAELARDLERRVDERTRELLLSHRETIETLSRAASYRDEETGAHVRRISHYCVLLAQRFGQDEEFCETIRFASPMHDVGKIAIPDRILLHPGPLAGADWETMKTHSAAGEAMLAGGDSRYLRMGREIARAHHERFDGSGYPDALAGEAIPLAARMMAVADVYDALRSARPYKPAFEHAHAVHVMLKGDARTHPRHFDPKLLACFADCAPHFAAIFDEHVDEAPLAVAS
jgi:putative two-component system response regulator